MIMLSRDFVQQKFWNTDDYRLTQLWIDDLTSIGYRFPTIRTPIDRLNLSHTSDNTNFSNCRPAHYLAKNVAINNSALASSGFRDLQTWCNQYLSVNKTDRFVFRSQQLVPTNMSSYLLNVALVITFNYPVLPTLSLIQRLYAPHFANTIFCGTFDSAILSNTKDQYPEILAYSFIHVTQSEMSIGHQGYYCTAKVYEMRIPNLIGYVIMSDDTVYNIDRQFDLNRFQLRHIVLMHERWRTNGAAEIGRTLQLIRDRISINNRSRLATAWSEYSKNVGGDGYSIMNAPSTAALSDWYYVPINKMWIFYELAEVMVEARVFHEIAVAKIGAGIGFLEEYKHPG
jgi:hypothetical protein